MFKTNSCFSIPSRFASKGQKKHHCGNKRNKCQSTHHKGFVLAYLMKNKMPLVHHSIKQQGCDCIIKDDKSVNGRTWGHPMSKPKLKLM
jgi:hypothetical protein